MKKYRIEVPGSNSVWADTYAQAEETAEEVMALNRFGYIHKCDRGPSLLIARFAPHYGLVPATSACEA